MKFYLSVGVLKFVNSEGISLHLKMYVQARSISTLPKVGSFLRAIAHYPHTNYRHHSETISKELLTTNRCSHILRRPFSSKNELIDSAFIISGPEENFDMPKQSLGKYIFNCLKSRDPDSIINIDPVSKKVLTCKALLEASVRMTKVFEHFSLKKTDRIAIISENNLSYCQLVLAALYMGITVALINPAYYKIEMKHALGLSKPKLVICSPTCVDLLLELQKEVGYIETVLTFECTDHPDIPNIDHLQNSTAVDFKDFAPADFDYTEKTAFIFLSSGTTGLPKGVMTSHKNLRLHMGFAKSAEYCDCQSTDTIAIVLPLFHIGGMGILLMALTSGTKIVFFKQYIPEVFLQTIQDYKITKLPLVPQLLSFLIDNPLVNSYNISSVLDVWVGGSSLGAEKLEKARKRLHPAKVKQMYGLTETTSVVIIGTSKLHKRGTIGSLIPGVKAKVCDLTTRQNVGPLHRGELCFKGDNIMQGYLGNKYETNKCIDEDGFCHSGDVGYYDEDNLFYFEGRIKDLIKYKSFQVAPAEIEALLLTHPNVKDCAVIGIPDDTCGELPLAFVVPKNNTKLTKKEVTSFVAERLSSQKHLRGGVQFVDRLPSTPLGKVLKKQLLQIWMNTNTKRTKCA